MKNMQKAGGLSALVSAASYIFAIGLYATLMMPLSDPKLGIGDYVAFLDAQRSLAFVWNYSMYIVHGLSLVVLVLALNERLATGSPRLARVASGLGFIWTAFVLLSGFINLWGNEALIALHASSPARAEAFKDVLSNVTLGIDASDKVLGSLWVALVSLAALKARVLPKLLGLFGLALGAIVFVAGLVLPVNDASASLLFGLGAIVWWIGLGIYLLRKPGLEQELASQGK